MENSRLRLKPTIKEWTKLRDHLEAFTSQHHLPDAMALTIQLVCEEWFLNIVNYAFAGDDASEREPVIEFHITRSLSNDVSLTFVDNGVPFNPLKHPLPNTRLSAQERTQGGLGIFLIRTLMDQCQYERKEGCNHFTMMKKL